MIAALDRPNQIAVVGAGTMGAGIAEVAARAGHPVVVIDASATSLERAERAWRASVERLVARGRLESHAADGLAARIRWSGELAAVAGAGLIVEAIAEDAEAKRALFNALERLVDDQALIATNTSSLSVASLGADRRAPGRFLGLHFFNPAPAMRLVEVVGSPQTNPAVLAAAIELMKRWGKCPVIVRDVPGFIVNRVARPYYAEGFAALSDGAAAADIDHSLVAAGGFRLGPLALSDLIGQDVNYAVASSILDAYRGATRFRLQPLQAQLVADGLLGQKTGTGAYRSDEAPPGLWPAAPPPERVAVSPILLQLEPLRSLARSAGLPLVADPALARDEFDVDGIRLAAHDGRRAITRSSAAGCPVALLDTARNLAQAPTLVFSLSHPGLSAARNAAAGFAQALGREALFLPDRPGGVVLRSLAQLANAAIDALADGVASASDIDEAMMAGANHPEGPLAWADRFGLPLLARVLENIAAETGDAIYAPAALLAERARYGGQLLSQRAAR